jgi:tetratricopeptide (TPR) repeat protein
MDQGEDLLRAEQLARSGVRRIEEVGKRVPAAFDVRKDYPRALGVLSNLLIRLKKDDEAEQIRKDGERQLRQVVSDFPDVFAAKTALADHLTNRANKSMGVNDLIGARKLLDEAMAIREEVLRLTPADYEAIGARNHLIGKFGDLFAAEGKLDEATVQFKKQLDLYREARLASPNNAALIEGEAQASMSLGNLASARRDFAGSLSHFRAALELAEPLLADRGRLETREIVRNCHWGLADSLVHLNRHAESAPHWAGMVALIRDPKAKAPFRTDRALALARSGKTDEAVAEIDELEATRLIGKESHGNAAAIYSLASAKAGDTSVREALQQKAIRSLRTAHAAGALPATFPSGNDFAPLRDRPDFGKLAEELRRPAKTK